MGRERGFPLSRVLLIGPAGAMRCVIGLNAVGQRLGGGGGEPDGSAAGLAGGDRIGAFEQQLTAAACLLARVGQTDGVGRPEAVIVFPGGAVAIDPPAAMLVLDAQIEPA